MNPTFSLGRIAGVRIGLNWSWAIVFGLIVWSLRAGVFPAEYPGLAGGTYLVMAVVAALVYFASLLLHELGHAVQARREGVEIDGITLWLFGGVARFRGTLPSAGTEFRIAIAGPLVTLVLGAAFVAASLPGGEPRAVTGVLAWLGYINLLLLAFNMLPAMPLDGGRVLRSALWGLRGDLRRATETSGAVARALSFLMIWLGVVLFMVQGAFGGAWLAFLGWFLLTASAAETRFVMVREALHSLRVSDLMTRTPVTVRVEETLGEFMDETAAGARHHVYPVLGDGRVAGLLPFSEVARRRRSEWDRTMVGECALPVARVTLLGRDDDAADAFARLSDDPWHRALVVEGDRLVGMLSLSDLARALSPARMHPA